VVLGDDVLRLTHVLDLHPTRILTYFRARSDENHDLSVAVENVGMGLMAAFIAGVNPDLKFPNASLRHV
jgi:hypothetical protein